MRQTFKEGPSKRHGNHMGLKYVAVALCQLKKQHKFFIEEVDWWKRIGDKNEGSLITLKINMLKDRVNNGSWMQEWLVVHFWANFRIIFKWNKKQGSV